MSKLSHDQCIGAGNGRNTISIKASLAARIYEEEPGMYVSHCPALDLYSQGATEEEAEKNIIEATELFILSCIKRNTLNEVLKASGFRAAGTKPPKKKTAQKQPPAIANQREIRIPAELPVMVA